MLTLCMSDSIMSTRRLSLETSVILGLLSMPSISGHCFVRLDCPHCAILAFLSDVMLLVSGPLYSESVSYTYMTLPTNSCVLFFVGAVFLYK